MKKIIFALALIFSINAIAQTDNWTNNNNDEYYWLEVDILDIYGNPIYQDVILYTIDTGHFRPYIDTIDLTNIDVLKLPGTGLQYVKGDGSFATFPTIPTNTNQLTNGAGFVTGSALALKLSISDTASMLDPYLREGAAAAAYSPVGHAHTFASLTGKPTTLAGYGITDAYPLTGNPSGFLTSASLPGNNNFKSYSAGTVYTLTTSSSKVDFGTTDPAITITTPGTYLIYTNIKIEYSGLTTALNTCNFKLRRTNNSPADISNATTTFNVPAATLLTGTGGDVDIPMIVYTTSNSNDNIELWGNRSGGITLGSINVGEASIVAVRIY